VIPRDPAELATRGERSAVVSDLVRTVGGLSIGRHVCIWFDDGDGVELLCVCGARAVSVVDEETGEQLLVTLADEPAPLAATA
jgi:hypothetical protein